jgi:hypothetical protein
VQILIANRRAFVAGILYEYDLDHTLLLDQAYYSIFS